MGKKINAMKEMKELRIIEKTLRENIEFTSNDIVFHEWVIGTDTKYRTRGFNGFSKAKLNRFLEYLDKMTIDTVNCLKCKVIDENEYKARMFIHCSTLMTIKETCKVLGWTISKNWIIK